MLRFPAAFLVGFGAVVLGSGSMVERTDARLIDEPSARVVDDGSRQVSAGEGRLRSMLENDECWVNDGESHPIPTRVWLRHLHAETGDTFYRIHGRGTVSIALNQIFQGTETDLDVVAFCE